MAGHPKERTRASVRLAAAVPTLDATTVPATGRSTSPTRRGTKRKNEARTPKNKKMKVQSCYLAGMPLDIVYEIFSHLSAEDLSRLAKIRNKSLYMLLTEPTSKVLWKAARARFVPPMPDCPSNMQEHVFVTFLLRDTCQYCHKQGPRVQIIHAWSAQRVICHDCVDRHCRVIPSYSKVVKTPKFLRKLFARKGGGRPVDTVCFNDYLPLVRIPHGQLYYFVEYFKIWEAEALKMETVEERWQWLEKKQPLANFKKCTKAFDNWRLHYIKHQKHQCELRVKSRQALVLEYARSIGWSEEIDKKASSELGVEAHPQILVACQKNITEHSLKKLKQVIETHMLQIKCRRLARERRGLLSSRLPVLKQAYSTYCSNFTYVQTRHFLSLVELFLEPAIQDIIFNTPSDETLTEAHLLPTIVEIVPGASQREIQRIKKELLEIIRNALTRAQDPTPVDRDLTLNLATTVFRCMKSYNCPVMRNDHFLSAEDAMLHPCIMTKNIPETPNDRALISLHLGGYLLRSPSESLVFKEETATAIGEIVKACGLDPSTTTKQTMDQLNYVFECIKCCEGPLRGRPMGSWATMANHYTRMHRRERLSFQPRRLIGDEEVVVRARITEQTIRKWNDPAISRDVLACAHCGKSGCNKADLDFHIKNQHNKVTLTKEDFILNPAGVGTPDIYYLWPPRPDENVLILNFME